MTLDTPKSTFVGSASAMSACADARDAVTPLGVSSAGFSVSATSAAAADAAVPSSTRMLASPAYADAGAPPPPCTTNVPDAAL